MPSSKLPRWLLCALAVLTALPAQAFDMERDTWLFPDEAAVPNTLSQDPLEFARFKADGNFQEPEYAQGEQAELIAAVGRDDFKAVSELLAKGVNPNLSADRWDDRALPRAVAKGNVEMVRILLDAGADPDLMGGGFTPLGRAALDGHTRIAGMLLRAGADVDRKSRDGNTPITAAVLMHRVGVVKALLAYHPDFSIWNQDGMVPLAIAANEGSVEMTLLLLDAGADVNELDRNGNPPLAWASLAEISKLLVGRGGVSSL